MPQAQYDLGITGPVSTYPGDPNDYKDTSSNFNWNMFYSDTMANFGNLFSGIANVISASKGNPANVFGNNNQSNLNQRQDNQDSGKDSIDWGTIAIVGVVVMIVIAMLFFLFKSLNKTQA